MLRSQNRLLFALRAASHLPAFSPHRFLLSTAAAVATTAATTPTTTATFPAQFVAEDYLVATCGLAPAQALRASKYLRHLKSPANPDAVRAFLADVGLAKADVSTAIAIDPRFLCSRVDDTLTPRVAKLRDIGLSPPQISRLITIVPGIFVTPSRISRLEFYLSVLGSYDKVEAALKRNFYLLNRNIEKVVKPNTAFLQQCGLTACDIAKLYGCTGKLLTMEPECVKEIVARAEKLGVRRFSGMFKKALVTVCNLTPAKISAKMDFLERALGRSEAELAVCKSPSILGMSEGKLGHTLEFLRMEVGLEPSYIVRRPAMLTYSLERRLMPRHYVIEVLKAKELVKKDIDFYNVFAFAEKRFVEKYLDPYNECVPGLADAYAAGCAGKIRKIQL